MIALKNQFTNQGATIVWVAHGFSHQERILNLSVIRQAQVTEHIVQRMFQTLQMIDYVLVKHGAAGDFAGFKLIDLVADQVHRIDLSIHRSFGLGHLISKA